MCLFHKQKCHVSEVIEAVSYTHLDVYKRQIFVYETKKNNMPSILILEDDITFSLMLKTWLGRKGFEVSSVSSVSDARSRIEDASFDLILSDSVSYTHLCAL